MKPPFDISRLKLDRTLVSLDLETTGVKVGFDRIVEIGVCKITPSGEYSEWTTFVNPGLDIPRGASLVHKITTERVRSCKFCCGALAPMIVEIEGNATFPLPIVEEYHLCTCETFTPWPTFEDLARGLSVALTDVDLAGYNIIDFDVLMLQEEFRRVGIAWEPKIVLDSYKIYRKYQKQRLTDAYLWYTGKDLEGAHGAIIDARAALEVLTLQPERHSLPNSTAALHHLVFEAPAPGALDPDSTLIWIKGEACIGFGKKHKGKTLKEVKALDPGYLRWMLKEQFSKPVKEVVAAALEGKFPKETL